MMNLRAAAASIHEMLSIHRWYVDVDIATGTVDHLVVITNTRSRPPEVPGHFEGWYVEWRDVRAK